MPHCKIVTKNQERIEHVRNCYESFFYLKLFIFTVN